MHAPARKRVRESERAMVQPVFPTGGAGARSAVWLSQRERRSVVAARKRICKFAAWGFREARGLDGEFRRVVGRRWRVRRVGGGGAHARFELPEQAADFAFFVWHRDGLEGEEAAGADAVGQGPALAGAEGLHGAGHDGWVGEVVEGGLAGDLVTDEAGEEVVG